MPRAWTTSSSWIRSRSMTLTIGSKASRLSTPASDPRRANSMPMSIAFSMPFARAIGDLMASYPDQPKKLSRAKGARGPQVPRDEQNSVTPGSTSADRLRKVRSEAAAQDENTIRARRARIQSRPTEDPKPKPATEQRGAPDTDSRTVPAHIHARYIKVGNKYHFTNGDLAFADRGRGLSTRLENTQVIRDLIAIAKERGWNDIALKGTDRFRKEAWQQANLAGLTVRGYQPRELA